MFDLVLLFCRFGGFFFMVVAVILAGLASFHAYETYPYTRYSRRRRKIWRDDLQWSLVGAAFLFSMGLLAFWASF